MVNKSQVAERLFNLSPDKIKQYFIDTIKSSKKKELAWINNKISEETGIQKGKEEVADLVWKMYSYCVKDKMDLLEDCGAWAAYNSIEEDYRYEDKLIKYVTILKIANEIGIDVDGYVSEYINHLTSLTCEIASEEGKDTSGLHIDPLYKPLFNLITKMCESGKHEALFWELSDFSVFTNLPVNLKGYEYHDFDARPYDERVDISMFNECLDEYLKRLSYKEVKDFLHQTYFYYDQAEREDKKEHRDFTEFNCEVSNNFWKKTRKRIEVAAREKIDLSMIKKSGSPLALISEKFPNITANSIFNYVFENEITQEYPKVDYYNRTIYKSTVRINEGFEGDDFIEEYSTEFYRCRCYFNDMLKGNISSENKIKIIDCLLNAVKDGYKNKHIGAVLDVLINYFEEDGNNYLGRLLNSEKESLKHRPIYQNSKTVYYYKTFTKKRDDALIWDRLHEDKPYNKSEVLGKMCDFYLDDIKHIFKRDYEKYTPEARAEISQIIKELEGKKEDEQ